MKRSSVLIGMAMLVLFGAAASQVQADYMNWTYTASPNTPGISVGSTSPTGGASITLTDFSTPQAGAASIPVIAYVTSTANTGPVSFSNSTFGLALTLTDGTTHDSRTLNFTGSLAGSLSSTTSSVIASFVPVTSNALTLDGHTYTVNIPTVTLASPTSPQQDIMANVSVANASSGGGGTTTPPPPPPHHGGGTGGGAATPEPASLLLGSLGFSYFGISCWWNRRRLTRTAVDA